MGSIVTSNLHLLTLFVWIVCVLTSSVNNEGKTDGTSAVNDTSAISINAPSTNDQQPLPSMTRPAPESVDPTKALSKSNYNMSLLGEGGPISISSTTERPSTISHLPNIFGGLHTEDNVSKEDSSRELSAKSQSKIYPRKGANPVDIEKTSSVYNKISLPKDTKVANEDSAKKEVADTNQQHINADADAPKLNTSIQQLNSTINPNANANANVHDTNMSQQKTTASDKTQTPSTTKKPKRKPTVTIGGADSDKPIHVSPTKSPPLGMPRKIDYIIPVIITMVALPLLGAATFIIYRRGRDCWDKRHYRRMDFLIDGMYND